MKNWNEQKVGGVSCAKMCLPRSRPFYVPSIKRVLILLAGGLELSLRTSDHFAIRNATDDELTAIKLNADGFEIYFPKLDEGFWVPDLLERLLGVRKFLSHPVEERIAA